MIDQKRVPDWDHRAAGLVHELKNQLSALQLYLELALREGDQESSSLSRVKSAQSHARRAAKLARGLLDEAHTQPIRDVSLEVSEFLLKNRELWELILGEEITLELALPPEGSGLPVRVDPFLLEGVLLNLVINAGLALQEGGTVWIRAGKNGGSDPAAEGNGDGAPGIWIEVRDSGPGIPEESRERIFEPFYSTRENTGSSGMGLFMAARMAEDLGGKLILASQPDDPTTFRFFIPQKEPSK